MSDQSIRFPLNNNSNTLISPHHQPQSTFNTIPQEVQLIIFQKFALLQLAQCALVCKEWKELTEKKEVWILFGKSLGLTQFGTNPKSDYQKTLENLSKFNLKEKLGEEVFAQLDELKTWEEGIDFQCPEGTFESGHVCMYDLAAIQKIDDKKNHFGKKIVGNDLVFIFVTADRLDSKIYRFNLSFDPQDFSKDQYLCWECGIEDVSGFFLDNKESAQKRNYELSFHWNHLKEEFSVLLGINQKKIFNINEFFSSFLKFNIERDVLQLNKPQD